jgi:hypothetical protein
LEKRINRIRKINLKTQSVPSETEAAFLFPFPPNYIQNEYYQAHLRVSERNQQQLQGFVQCPDL